MDTAAAFSRSLFSLASLRYYYDHCNGWLGFEILYYVNTPKKILKEPEGLILQQM
jgi:hypothetical protein